jgi:acetyl-CoA carboxylase biotin carboxyl carrier protein
LKVEDLEELLRVLRNEDIAEFELEEAGMKLRIRKAGSAAALTLPSLAAPAEGAQSAATSALPAAASPAPATADDGLVVVKSPIVGTFYRSADPNAAPFVQVGDSVRVGQVLCIIEAMKLMNEIESEFAGEVVKVHHENGQPVQYGEPLFAIRAGH